MDRRMFFKLTGAAVVAPAVGIPASELLPGSSEIRQMQLVMAIDFSRGGCTSYTGIITFKDGVVEHISHEELGHRPLETLCERARVDPKYLKPDPRMFA